MPPIDGASVGVGEDISEGDAAPAPNEERRGAGKELAPPLGALLRDWIPRDQIIGLHPKIQALVSRLDLAPTPAPTLDLWGRDALNDHLWAYPVVLVPLVKNKKEIEVYRVISGIGSYQLLSLLPPAEQVHVLRSRRRIDNSRMYLAAIAELRMTQLQLKGYPGWQSLADRNLTLLERERARHLEAASARTSSAGRPSD